MSMQVEAIAFGVAAPILISSIVLVLTQWSRKLDAAVRQPAAFALVVGFCAAYVLFSWTPLFPKEHWQWLPLLAVVALAVAWGAAAPSMGHAGQWAMYLLLAGVTAWRLVPGWASLESMRGWHYFVVAGGVLSLWVLLEPLAAIYSATIVCLAFFTTALAGAVVLLLAGNLKFAQLAGSVATALLGCLLVTALFPKQSSFRGAAIPFVILVGGLLYVGRIHSFSDVPTASYVLVAAAPLGLWATATGCALALPKRWQAAAGIAAVSLPLAVALGLAVMA